MRDILEKILETIISVWNSKFGRDCIFFVSSALVGIICYNLFLGFVADIGIEILYKIAGLVLLVPSFVIAVGTWNFLDRFRLND